MKEKKSENFFKKIAKQPAEYAFIDDTEKNSRYNNSMIQSGGGHHLKKKNLTIYQWIRQI